ncbi:TPA: 50S ribosomal protein L37ae [Candidatus Micrarchaeota archaeon]|nr:50S ribosomal protein L37ae [Candidatus Micrarchaeota archaeon]
MLNTQKYGAKLRKLVNAALKSKCTRYECPKCRKLKVVRKANALWKCKSCEAVFAGGAYSFATDSGNVVRRTVAEYES